MPMPSRLSSQRLSHQHQISAKTSVIDEHLMTLVLLMSTWCHFVVLKNVIMPVVLYLCNIIVSGRK